MTKRVSAGYASRASPGSTLRVTVPSAYAVWVILAGVFGNPSRSSSTRPSRSAFVTRPWASRTENVAVHVAPGASVVHVAVIDVAEATWKLTPTHAPVGRTSTTSSGVRGSGLTSPPAPTTEIVHELPDACEHCCTADPPCGSVDGAAPTRRMSRAGETRLWLVTDTIAASS